MSFNWATFVDHLSVANIGATLSNPANDNVQLVTVLGGPIGNWKYWSESGTDISGNLASGSSWTVPFALQLTLGGPNYATLGAKPNLAAVPAYANYLATVPVGNWDSDTAAFPGGVNVVKGISLMGNGGWGFFECHSVTDTVWIEQYFRTNPDAVDKTKGYPGVFYIYRNGGSDFYAQDYAAIEEHRVGLFELDANVSDSAFDGSTMRAGLWVKQVGSVYEIKRIINGVVIEAATMPVGAGFYQVNFDLQFYYQNIAVTGTQAAVEMPCRVNGDPTDYVSQDFTFHAVDLLNVKYVQYTKPSPSNTVPFDYDIEHMLLTDPSYVPPLGGSDYFEAVHDTFTGPDGMSLRNHTGEVGAIWTVRDDWGNEAPDSCILTDGAMARPIYVDGGDNTNVGGETMAYPNGRIPADRTQFTIEFGVRFLHLADYNYAFVAVYEGADTEYGPGNIDMIFQMENSTASGTGITLISQPGFIGGTVSFTPVIMQEYIVRLEFDGNNVQMFLDDVFQLAATRDPPVGHAFGFDLFDMWSEGTPQMTYLKIFAGSVGGPGEFHAFWTDYVETKETESAAMLSLPPPSQPQVMRQRQRRMKARSRSPELAIEPLSIAGGVVVFDDTFTGTGDLSTHIPDICSERNNHWTYWQGVPLTDVKLDGAGNYTVPVYGTDGGAGTGGQNSVIWPWCTQDVVDNFEVEVTFSHDGYSGDGGTNQYGIDVYAMHGVDNQVWSVGVFPQRSTDLFGSPIPGPDLVWVYGLGDGHGTSVTLTSDSVLQIRRTPGHVYASINGVTVMDETFLDDQYGDIVLFNMFSFGPTSHIKVSRFKITNGFSSFWTDFTLTSETS